MSNKNNLSVPGRIRTCDLQLRRLLLYPAELLRLNKYYIKRVKGVEPSTSAWKAGVLPLNYTRIYTPYCIKINLIKMIDQFRRQNLLYALYLFLSTPNLLYLNNSIS